MSNQDHDNIMECVTSMHEVSPGIDSLAKRHTYEVVFLCTANYILSKIGMPRFSKLINAISICNTLEQREESNDKPH